MYVMFNFKYIKTVKVVNSCIFYMLQAAEPAQRRIPLHTTMESGAVEHLKIARANLLRWTVNAVSFLRTNNALLRNAKIIPQVYISAIGGGGLYILNRTLKNDVHTYYAFFIFRHFWPICVRCFQLEYMIQNILQIIYAGRNHPFWSSYIKACK